MYLAFCLLSLVLGEENPSIVLSIGNCAQASVAVPEVDLLPDSIPLQ